MLHLNFGGKRVLVCGSSQGIGYAIAKLFADHHANVTLFARNAERLHAALQSLPVHSDQHHEVLIADFCKPEEVHNAIVPYAKAHPIDIVVNNSGGPPPGRIIDTEPQQFLTAFTQHLIANQIILRAVLPSMQSQHFGRIINIISTSVREPIPNLGVSNTIRGAVASWAKTLSRELAQWNITVNNVLPGATETQRLLQLIEAKAERSGQSPEKVRETLLAEIPMGRFAQPSEIAAMVLFLASEAASYITGVSIPIDGGRMRCL